MVSMQAGVFPAKRLPRPRWIPDCRRDHVIDALLEIGRSIFATLALRAARAEGEPMALMRPDPTFYPSPGMAMQAPPESLAYVALLNVGNNGKKDAMGVVDLDPGSSSYGRLVGQVNFSGGDNELHHFGWNRSEEHTSE